MSEILLAALLAALGLAVLNSLARQLPPAVVDPIGMDAWFQADLPRTLSNMVDVQSNHFRTKVHPISSIVLHPIVTGLRSLWPGTDLQAAMRFMWIAAALWIAGFYGLCRLLGSSRTGSSCFALLAIGSAAFQFWFTVPETFGIGSLTLLMVLLVAALAVHRPLGDRWLVAASIASLGITVTNWIAGLALAAVHRPWRRAFRISAIAFVVVAVLAVVQRFIYRLAKLFFRGSEEELDYMNLEHAGTTLNKLAGIFWSPMSLPEVLVRTSSSDPKPMNWLTVQQSMPGSGTSVGVIVLVLWTLLLVAGAYGLVRSPEWRSFGKVLGVTLGAQVAMHLFYGDETFLYAAHFLPLLLAVAVFAQRSPLGRLAPVLALVAAGLAAFNNAAVFSQAAALLRMAPAAS